jgi:hypothetical protein
VASPVAKVVDAKFRVKVIVDVCPTAKDAREELIAIVTSVGPDGRKNRNVENIVSIS